MLLPSRHWSALQSVTLGHHQTEPTRTETRMADRSIAISGRAYTAIKDQLAELAAEYQIYIPPPVGRKTGRGMVWRFSDLPEVLYCHVCYVLMITELDYRAELRELRRIGASTTQAHYTEGAIRQVFRTNPEMRIAGERAQAAFIESPGPWYNKLRKAGAVFENDARAGPKIINTPAYQNYVAAYCACPELNVGRFPVSRLALPGGILCQRCGQEYTRKGDD